MIYFNCPHCAQAYNHHALFEQDVELISNPIALEVEVLPITCDKCHKPFKIARLVNISFEVTEDE